MNSYYTYDSFFCIDIEKNGVTNKISFAFSLKKYDMSIFVYTIPLYNPDESSDVTITFLDGTIHHINDNTL